MKNFLALIFLFVTLSAGAQLNPKDIFVNGKNGQGVTYQIHSLGFTPPSVVVFPSAPYDTLSFDPLGGGVYEFTFDPVDGFLGDTKLTIQYYQSSGIPGFNLPNYTTIHYRVEESKLDCHEDYELIDANSTTEINVIDNDSTTDGILTLDRISYVSGGTASIVNNNISFTPDNNSSSGLVSYFTSDDQNNIEGSHLYLSFEDDLIIEERTIYVDKLGSVDLHLNSLNYSPVQLPSSGTLTQNGHVWNYKPSASFTGTQTLEFVSPNGGSIIYNINVLQKVDNRSFVNDDRYFVPTNGSINFNVFDNDYLNTFNIIDYSAELNYQGNGEFQFSPDTDFTGDLVFFYKIFAGFQFHTGNIIIHVDEFAPSTEYEYTFNILKNHDLVIQHEAPIQDYFFNLVTTPQLGQVIILDNSQSEVLECDAITGDHSIIYIPNAGESGVENFTVEFCTVTGICENVSIQINILDSNYDECLCLSECIYKGDHNNDGVVNIRDVLELTLNIGEGGSTRNNDFNQFWTGQYADNWGYELLQGTQDLKHADGDGNGFIDYDDLLNVEEYYSAVHSFVPNNIGQLSNVPITFVPQSTEVDSGEWLFLDIYAGSSSLPALDVYGLTFSFNINPDIIDSSSMEFVLAENNWLSYLSPLYQLAVVPVDGKIDIAVSRINNISTDGIGIIGTLGFIVEEEVEGFKEQGFSNYISQQITMNNIISVNEFGEYKLHPNQTKEILVAVENNSKPEEDISIYMDIYPNPTSDYLNIQSNKYSIDKIEVYDAVGRLIHNEKISQNYQTTLDMSSWFEGIYLLRVYSHNQTTSSKIYKFNP